MTYVPEDEAPAKSAVGELDLSQAMSTENAPDDALPRMWTGERSDAHFRAHKEGDYWVMALKVEAQRPVLIQNAYLGVTEMEHFADVLDLAMAFARGDDAIIDEEARSASMGLIYASQMLRQTGINLKDGVRIRRQQIEVDTDSFKALKEGEESAETLIRIADRITARLNALLGAPLVALLELGPPSDMTH